MSEELKPCPFCGGDAKSGFDYSCDCCGQPSGSAYCTICDASIAHSPSEQAAIIAWNTREPDPRIAELERQLEAANDKIEALEYEAQYGADRFE